MGLGGRRRQPGRVEGAVELDPGHSVRLGLANGGDRFLLRGGDVGDLGGVGPFAVDQGRGIDPGAEQIALRPPLAPRHRQRGDVARIARRGDARARAASARCCRRRNACARPTGRGRASCPCRRSAGAPAGGRVLAAGPTATIRPLSTTTVCASAKRLPSTKARTLVKATGPAGAFRKRRASDRRAGGERLVLRFLERRLGVLVADRDGGEEADRGEELAVLGRPDRDRAVGDSGDGVGDQLSAPRRRCRSGLWSAARSWPGRRAAGRAL